MLSLKTSQDFQRVRREGHSWGHPLVVLIALHNDQDSLRIGIAAGKSVGSAVARNRAKRRLRSAVRLAETQMSPGWDVVLIARPPLLKAKWPEVTEALAQLMRRAKLMHGSEG